MRTLFGIAVTVGLVTLAAQSGPPQVGKPYVEFDVCGGECCVLGLIRATARVPVLVSASPSAKIVDWLASGDTVLPSKGDLHWTRVGDVLLTRSHEYQAFENEERLIGVLQRGDTVPVLSDMGEGHINIWHEGQKRLVFVFWDDGRQYPPPKDPPGRLVVRGESHWWLRVRTKRGVEGWISWSHRLSAVNPPCA